MALAPSVFTRSHAAMHNPIASGRKIIALHYAALSALFINIIWLSWKYVDLTSGDTSAYYITARRFSTDLTCNIAWSPIYTSLLGAFRWINPDPYFAVLGHRILILAIITVLIFEIARRIMDPWVAWFVTAWWLCLPINFHSLYEVHLFAVIPILIFWLILTCRQTPRARGWALGVLLTAMFLVRNEFLIPLAIFTLASAGYDIARPERILGKVAWSKYIKAYGIPVLLAFALIGTTYWRSTVKFPELKAAFRAKHTLNVAQIYAFGYGQRHPEYRDSPWTDSHSLMQREFGADDISMGEAFAKNPEAMMSHFLWNAGLIPSGIQLGLFNVRSGDINPDYAPSRINRPVALSLSLAVVGIFTFALCLALRSPEPAKRWLEQNAWLVVGMASACAAVAVVMIMQRPRPSYMFTLTLTLMLLTGLAVSMIRSRFKHVSSLVPMLLCGALIVFTPTFRDEQITPVKKVVRLFRGKSEPIQPRLLLTYYRLLAPHAKEFAALQANAAVAGYPSELNAYLGLDGKKPAQHFIWIDEMLRDMGATETIEQRFSTLNVRYALFRHDQLALPVVHDFLADNNRWEKIDAGHPGIIFVVKK